MGCTQGMVYVCVEDLRKLSKGKNTAFRFCVPIMWREPKNHSDDCYFCCCDVKGYNSKNKTVILYPNLPSALRPVVHGPEVPVPQPTEILEDASTNILIQVEMMRNFGVIQKVKVHSCSLSLN
jgi:hypothetical protein